MNMEKNPSFRRFLSLLLAVAMILSNISVAVFATGETDPEPTEYTEAATEETTEPSGEPEEETTEEATEAATESATEVTTEAATEVTTEAPTEVTTEEATEVPTEVTTEAATEVTTEATTEEATEAPTEVTTEATTEAATEAAEPRLSEKLLAAETVKDFHDLLMSDTAAAYAMTAEELAAVKAHAEELYTAIEEPTEDDQDYNGLVMETIELLERVLQEDATGETTPETLEEPIDDGTYTLDLYYGSIQFLDDVVTYYDSEGVQQSITHDPANTYIITQSNATKTTTNTIAVGKRKHNCSSHTGTETETVAVTVDFTIVLAGVNVKLPENKTKYNGCSSFCITNDETSTVAVIIKNGTENYLRSSTCRAGLEIASNYIGPVVITCETGYERWKQNGTDGHRGADNFSACDENCGYLLASGGGSSGAGVHSGAGIGTAGQIPTTNNQLANLTIAGGRIRAIGGKGGGESSGGGAGIGNGSAQNKQNAGEVKNLKITGGTIDAVRGSCSASNIGGGYRSRTVYVTIYGGTIQATELLNHTADADYWMQRRRAAAIGGGGGGYNTASDYGATVTIYGGNIEAFGQYGSAIGAGAGGANGGGSFATVNIHGGTIKAWTDKGDGGGAGAAIGSGGSLDVGKGGNASVNITGGTITADSEFGAAIGGGGTQSKKSGAAGGNGEVKISGGIITVASGAIGGGRAKAGIGGDADVTITGGTINAVTIGGGESESGNGGKASVTVDGENANVTLSGIIGGGNSTSGNGGNASVTVHKGNLSCMAIGGGNSQTGSGGNIVGMEDDAGNLLPGIYFTGGIIRTGEIGGGTNQEGYVGYASALVEGGDIRGQFVMKASDQGNCTFKMTGGTIHDTDPAAADYTHTQMNGGAVYMDDNEGTAVIEGGTIRDCKGTLGGAVYMTGGTFTMSEGVIETCQANKGGAVYMSGNCTFTMTGGTIKNCSANSKNSSVGEGGAVYLGGGNVTINGGTIANNVAAENGGAVAVLSGNFTMSDGTIGGSGNGNTATNGGAIYVDGGNVELSGGDILNNTASVNGGGIAVNNGRITMSGGSVSGNSATSGEGGGMYVSSSGDDEVAVTIYSGTVSGNTASTNGGAVAVRASSGIIDVQVGVNHSHETMGFTHDEKYVHNTCPVIKDNQATNSGGAFFVHGGSATNLKMFCLEDGGNDAPGDVNVLKEQVSSFMMVEGGTVYISTADDFTGAGTETEQPDDSGWGKMNIQGSIHVVGGVLELFGMMDNPMLSGRLTVDLQSDDDFYYDHRGSVSKIKISYHENFYGLGGVIASTQTAFDLDHGQEHTIYQGLYAHQGYKLYGWNTDKDAIAGKTEDGWYEPGSTWIFKHPNHNLPVDTPKDANVYSGNLTLYAIWIVNGYVVEFVSGISEDQDWSGEVAGFGCEYNKKYALPNNGFVWPSHKFTGWKLPDGTVMQPGEEIYNLTDKNAATVTLVAQWEDCAHPATVKDAENNDVSNWSYTVNEAGDTLTKTCNLCKYSATAKLSALDAVYDGQEHKATLEYSDEGFWKDAEKNLPTIAYAGKTIRPQNISAEQEWEGEDVEYLCVSAGDYTATVQCGAVSAQVKYTIAKATQPAPTSRPTYAQPEGTSDLVTINLLPEDERQSPTSHAYAKYYVRYYTNNVENTVEAVDSNTETSAIEHKLTEALKTYSVLAGYPETNDYLASDLISAETTFVFAGKLHLTVKAEEGIDFWLGNVEESQMVIYVKLREGYYQVEKDEYAFNKVVTQGTYSLDNLTITSDSADELKQRHYINATTADEDTYITITIGGVKKIPTVSVSAAEKQHFSDFTPDADLQITRDSAFTVQYEIADYDSNAYQEPKLTFGAALPVGTTIILRNRSDGSYWYKPIDSATTTVSMAAFHKMGVGDAFATVSAKQKLQFIVDFSGAATKPEADSLTCNMVLAPEDGKNAPEVKPENALQVGLNGISCELKHTNDGSGLIQTMDVKISVGAAASRYDNRDLALVLTPASGTKLPKDAYIRLTVDGVKSVGRPQKVGSAEHIVISLGNFRSLEETVTLELCSDMFPMESAAYTMEAALYVAETDAEAAPLNGHKIAAEPIGSGENVKNALKFTSNLRNSGVVIESDSGRLLTSSDTVTVTVDTEPADYKAVNYKLQVELHQDMGSGRGYGDTLAKPSVSGNQYSFTLSGYVDGEYCIVATLSTASGYVLHESRFYFIIENP